NGDVLVAESDAPAKPEGNRGIRGWVMKKVMARAGSGGQSANRITLLRDEDGDGTPEVRTTFLEGLNSPFGMALVDDQLYIANTDALLRFPYEERSEEHTSELQSRENLVCRLLLEKKNSLTASSRTTCSLALRNQDIS